MFATRHASNNDHHLFTRRVVSIQAIKLEYLPLCCVYDIHHTTPFVLCRELPLLTAFWSITCCFSVSPLVSAISIETMLKFMYTLLCCFIIKFIWRLIHISPFHSVLHKCPLYWCCLFCDFKKYCLLLEPASMVCHASWQILNLSLTVNTLIHTQANLNTLGAVQIKAGTLWTHDMSMRFTQLYLSHKVCLLFRYSFAMILIWIHQISSLDKTGMLKHTHTHTYSLENMNSYLCSANHIININVSINRIFDFIE